MFERRLADLIAADSAALPRMCRGARQNGSCQSYNARLHGELRHSDPLRRPRSP